jgi:K+ transporter
VYTFNRKFTDRQRKIKMSLLVTKVSQDEKLSTKATVDEDRKHAVEASIVRVMKARKTMQHQQLVMEVSTQLMKLFKPDPKVSLNPLSCTRLLWGTSLALLCKEMQQVHGQYLRCCRMAGDQEPHRVAHLPRVPRA